jgi:N-acetylglucosaminyldiphosphoundecaprenol N-acetyl-beta-D-mannosaminyltransferase
MADVPGTSLRHHLFGIPINALTFEQTVRRCEELIESRQPVQHVSVNAGKLVLMQDHPALKAIVSTCDLVNADGQSVVWAGSILGKRIPERVAGIDLMEALLALSERQRWPVYFLGAKAEVLKTFHLEVIHRFPRIIVAGCHHGYFDDDERVADEIAGSGARLLFVGISSPRKEFLLAGQLKRIGPVFAMGVGGSFDVWAGLTRRAPRWMQAAGLEWFFRFLQEPTRMWKRYLVGNSRFIWMVLCERFRARNQ